MRASTARHHPGLWARSTDVVVDGRLTSLLAGRRLARTHSLAERRPEQTLRVSVAFSASLVGIVAAILYVARRGHEHRDRRDGYGVVENYPTTCCCARGGSDDPGTHQSAHGSSSRAGQVSPQLSVCRRLGESGSRLRARW